MDMSLPDEATQKACAVCGRPAHVWCHNDEASLCNTCDAKVHSASPLAMMHKRTPLLCGVNGEGRVAQAIRACYMERGGCASGESCKEVCLRPCFNSPSDKTPYEQESSGDEILQSEELDNVDWNPPDLSNWLADESFDVNVLDLNSDLALFVGSETQPWEPATHYAHKAMPASALPEVARINPLTNDVPYPSECCPALEPLSSTGSDCCPGQPLSSPHIPPPVATPPIAAKDAGITTTTTSSSGPAVVPSASSDSQDNYLPQPVGAVDSAAMPHPAEKSVAVASSASNPTDRDHPPAPMIPYYMAQPMMNPSMMWANGACFMPMFTQNVWETYTPATLLPKVDPAAHEARVLERRSKRARFLEKKHRLSCRKAVRYASRKRYADSRPRVNGRFISKCAAAAAAASSAIPVCGESP